MRKIHMFANADFSKGILYFAFFCSPSRCLLFVRFDLCVCVHVFFFRRAHFFFLDK